MQESSLHATLKTHYSLPDGDQEVYVDGYLIDVVRDDVLVEIQTANFGALKQKLQGLLKNHNVLLVHPIPEEKWIIKLPADGPKPFYRRKSPKKGRTEDIFNELVYIGPLISDPNLAIEVVFTREEEIRRDDGKGSWRRRGVSVVDHRLLGLMGRKMLCYPEDYIGLLPQNLPDQFTNQQLAKELKIKTRLARKMTYTLRSMGVLNIFGKNRNEFLFEICL